MRRGCTDQIILHPELIQRWLLFWSCLLFQCALLLVYIAVSLSWLQASYLERVPERERRREDAEREVGEGEGRDERIPRVDAQLPVGCRFLTHRSLTTTNRNTLQV